MRKHELRCRDAAPAPHHPLPQAANDAFLCTLTQVCTRQPALLTLQGHVTQQSRRGTTRVSKFLRGRHQAPRPSESVSSTRGSFHSCPSYKSQHWQSRISLCPAFRHTRGTCMSARACTHMLTILPAGSLGHSLSPGTVLACVAGWRLLLF